jgi:putative pyoverdin transport system ATP-binding/permease protein
LKHLESIARSRPNHHEAAQAPFPDFRLAAGDRNFRQRAQRDRAAGSDDLRAGGLPLGRSHVVGVCLDRRFGGVDRALCSCDRRQAHGAVDRAHAPSVGEVCASPAFAGARSDRIDATVGCFLQRSRKCGLCGSQSRLAVRKCSHSVGCLAYIGWLSIREMLVTGSLCLITIGGAVFLRFLEKRYRHGAREAWDRVLTVFRMLLDGIKQLKVNRSLARRVLLSFEESVREQQRSAAARSRYSELVESWTQSMFYVILGAAVFGPYGAEASLRLGFGLLIVLQIRRPLRALIADSAAFSDALVAFERLSELGLTLTKRHREADDPQHAPARSRDWRSLDLKGVRFKYGDENSKDGFSLGPMDMSLTRGEVVFIAGGNGSGKTTLAKVLTGLYAPTGGAIQLDGINVDNENMHWYRRKFAAVFSDFCLFEGVADLQVEDFGSEMNWLMTRLQLSRQMLTAPASYIQSTPLTSGERGRIALVRAAIEDRPVFVFDGWAADQDHGYKDFFYQEFLPRLRGARKLAVVISDDERYFHTADRVLWLERGEPPVWRSPSSFAMDAGRDPQGA